MISLNFKKFGVSQGFLAEVATQFSDIKTYLFSLPAGSRWFHIFYLLGPLILLIERSPADFWLSICGLVFLCRCIVLRDWKWVRHFWVVACLLFWLACLLSSALSSLPAYSLGEALVWIRFPLFAFASCFWLAKNRQMIAAMLGMTTLGMLIMTGILIAEMLVVGQQGGRLSWPYGDLMPGNYLAKASMPAFIVIIALIMSRNKFLQKFSLFLAIFTIGASVLTGERINLILRLCAGFLTLCSWRANFKKLIIISAIFSMLTILLFVLYDDLKVRYWNSFIRQIPLGEHSHYYQVMRGGIDAFLSSPMVGIGTGNYRFICANIIEGNPKILCHNHPHHFYIQLLAETGLIGFLSGLLMILAILWQVIKTRLMSRNDVIMATAYIAPFAMFFPLQTTGDFFGQWNNIFIWSAIGLSLAARNRLT